MRRIRYAIGYFRSNSSLLKQKKSAAIQPQIQVGRTSAGSTMFRSRSVKIQSASNNGDWEQEASESASSSGVMTASTLNERQTYWSGFMCFKAA